MKKLIYIFALGSMLMACGKTDSDPASATETFAPCGKRSSGEQLYKGSKGGCYYINGNGNKTYVDRGDCKC